MTMPENVFRLGKDERLFVCGLALPEDQEQRAIEISNEVVETQSLKFKLDLKKHPPYIRVYEAVLPSYNVLKATARIQKLCDEMPSFFVNWGQLEHSQEFIALWAEKNEALSAFHDAIVEVINPLREGRFKQKYTSSEYPLTAEERQSIQEYGSPWAKNYIPHMILAKAKEKFLGNIPSIEWGYKRCHLLGVIIGVKDEVGEFTQYSISQFSGEE